MFAVVHVVFITVLESGGCCPILRKGLRFRVTPKLPGPGVPARSMLVPVSVPIRGPGQNLGCQALPTLGVCTEGQSQCDGAEDRLGAGLPSSALVGPWWDRSALDMQGCLV